MKIRVYRVGKTFWGGIKFRDDRHRYHLTLTTLEYEKMGKPYDLVITVENVT